MTCAPEARANDPQGCCTFEDCTLDAKWSGYCEGHYREVFEHHLTSEARIPRAESSPHVTTKVSGLVRRIKALGLDKSAEQRVVGWFAELANLAFDEGYIHGIGDAEERVSETAPRPEHDAPLPEDSQIDAAHPTKTGRHDLYEEAARMVGARHSKAGLVELVNWLLYSWGEERKKNAARRRERAPLPVPEELWLAAGDLALAAVRWVEARETERGYGGIDGAPTAVWQAKRDAEARLIMAVRKFARIEPPAPCASAEETSGTTHAQTLGGHEGGKEPVSLGASPEDPTRRPVAPKEAGTYPAPRPDEWGFIVVRHVTDAVDEYLEDVKLRNNHDLLSWTKTRSDAWLMSRESAEHYAWCSFYPAEAERFSTERTPEHDAFDRVMAWTPADRTGDVQICPGTRAGEVGAAVEGVENSPGESAAPAGLPAPSSGTGLTDDHRRLVLIAIGRDPSLQDAIDAMLAEVRADEREAIVEHVRWQGVRPGEKPYWYREEVAREIEQGAHRTANPKAGAK